MRVEICKTADGSGLLRCTRADGSVTWQKMRRHGAHFAFHDLTHFAVESTLGFPDGFYGLIAQGWDIEETTGKGVRGPVPAGALEVECLVGTLDAERASGCIWLAAEFNEMAAVQAANSGRPAPRPVSEVEINAVRRRRSELFRQWLDVSEGAELVLELPEAAGRRTREADRPLTRGETGLRRKPS